jgi:hypothetical protein
VNGVPVSRPATDRRDAIPRLAARISEWGTPAGADRERQADGTPHVVPVSRSYNAERGSMDVGGRDLTATKKYRDVARPGRAAIVIDAVLPARQPRGVEVRGRAEDDPGARWSCSG